MIRRSARTDRREPVDVQRRRLARAFACAPLVLGLPVTATRADSIDIARASLEPSIDGEAWLLSADLQLSLGNRLEDAVNRGVPLYFVADFALWRSRWWWFDDRVAEASQTWRLAYHALTRTYRLSLNGFVTRHASLAEAMDAISRIRGWRVLERGTVRAGTSYEASVRVRLDVSQLPKPFQLTALTDRDWNLQAEWKRFPFNPETARSAPSAER